MLSEEFIAYSRRVRSESIRLGAAPLDEEDAMQLYGIVFTCAASSDAPLTAVDLGAGVGYTSLWLAKALDDACPGRCRLVVVEPDRRLAEKAATLLHSYPFRRVGVRVVVERPRRYLEGLPESSVDIVLAESGREEYPALLRLVGRALALGGFAVFYRVLVPGTPPELFEAASRPPWRSTMLPSGHGTLIAVKASEVEG